MFNVAPQADLSVFDTLDEETKVLLRRIYPDFLLLLQSISHSYEPECRRRLVLEMKALVFAPPHGRSLEEMTLQQSGSSGLEP